MARLVSTLLALILTTLGMSGSCNSHKQTSLTSSSAHDENEKIAPKVLIISMFQPEADIWLKNLPSSGLGNITAHSLFTPGLSMLFPQIHCTSTSSSSTGDDDDDDDDDDTICHITLGEGEINAAVSATALLLSPLLDLTHTYFLLAGIAGVNPKQATLGSVALSRYAVQVALQYEIGPADLPEGWRTGYFGFGTKRPFEYPRLTYGTEVFELNDDLRNTAFALASTANLSDSSASRNYSKKYDNDNDDDNSTSTIAAANPPSIVRCDTTTSDVYFSGTALAESFETVVWIWTNGTGEYCMSAQEDNAILEAMVRAAIEGLVDFSRIILLRAGSNFDRPPPGMSDWEHLAVSDQNGFDIAIENTYRAGLPIVQGILEGWDNKFAKGIPASNYVGDILGSLGGKPDFGPGSVTGEKGAAPGGGGGGNKKRAAVNRYYRMSQSH